MKLKLTLIMCSLFVSIGFATAEPKPITNKVIYEKGYNDFDTFRIPAIVQSNSGTILAFAEARKNSRSDTGNIDLVLRRSTDGGQTWGDMITVWDDGENVCGNPSPVVVESTGRIVLLSTWNRGDDHERDIHEKVSKDTRRVFVLYSDDDGLTWSEPKEITASAKNPEWTWYATGPCHAIQLRQGKHKGRLVVPCNHGVFYNDPEHRKNEMGTESHVIYSDDMGTTWHIGGNAGPLTNESTIAELKGGDLLLNMRSARTKDRVETGACRRVVFSDDAGESFGKQIMQYDLIEPVCNGSIINYYSPKGKPTKTLLFSNPNHKTKRKDMTIRVSHDNGNSWQTAYQLSDKPAAYSDLLILDDQNVAILYETGEQMPYEKILFTLLESSIFKQSKK